MDVVSAASAIVALTGFAEAISKSVFTYAKSVKNCQKEIMQLSIEVTTLFGILRGAQLLLDKLESNAIIAKQVDECWKLLQTIETRLEKSRSIPALNSGFKNAVKPLIWPFTLSHTKELLTRIERQKTAFNLVISSEGLSMVVRNQNDLSCELRDLHHEIKQRHEAEVRLELNDHRKEILSFLSGFDSEGHFRTNQKLRHEGTGMWFINGDTFRKWTVSPYSHLWLYGIPGAGKTVLSSIIIETIMNSNQNNEAVAYFYCDYKSQQTQEPYTIFSSLAKQLAIQSQEAFDLVAKCYDAYHQNGRDSGKVDVDHLIDLISSMTKCFNSTSIVLDGLDECGDNVATVLDFWVSFLQGSAASLRTIVLSRDEWVIRKIFGDQHYNTMSIAAESTDIRRYAMAEIEKRCQRGDLDIDDPSFKLFIMEKLVEKAEGMFRWVACQFDFLQHLISEEAYREALESLPPGLPATYERMLGRLLKLPGSTLRVVQEALKWILFSLLPLDMASLCEAASVEPEAKKRNARSLVKPGVIERYCGSFIRKSDDGKYFESAHFSVKEYFQSLDPKTSPRFAGFCMSEQLIRVDQTITCLTYLTYEDFKRPVPRDLDEITKYAFYSHAAMYFPCYSRQCWHDESVQRLGRKLFNPERSSNLLLWCHYYLFKGKMGTESWESFLNGSHRLLSSDRNLALRWAAMLGVPFLVTSILSDTDEIDHNSPFGTPLHAAILGTCWMILNPIFSSSAQTCSNYRFLYRLRILNKWDEDRKSCVEKLFSPIVECGIFSNDPAGDDISLLELSLYTVDSDLIGKVAKVSGPLGDVLLERLWQLYKFVNPKAQAHEKVDDFFNNMFEAIGAAKVKIDCEEKYCQFTALVRSSAALGSNEREYVDTEYVDVTLRAAAEQGSLDVIADIVAVRGIDIDAIGCEGETALHLAAKSGSTRCVNLLIRKGASLNQRDFKGHSALHYAAQSGQLDCAIRLIDLQIDLEGKTLAGETLAHIAAQEDNQRLLQYLLDRFGEASLHVHDRDVFGKTPVLKAVEAASGNSLRFLIPFSNPNDKDLHEEPLLHVAAVSLEIEYLDCLIINGADQMVRCGDGKNVLHHLVNNPQATSKSLKSFIEAGVSVHDVDKQGDTPLHRLLYYRKLDDRERGDILLLTSKENINIANANGETPLHLLLDAIIAPDRKVQILRTFLDFGANMCLGTDTRESFFQEVVRRLAKCHPEKPMLPTKELSAEIEAMRRLLGVAVEAITEPQYLEQLVDNRRPLNVCLFDKKLSLELLSKGINSLLRNTDQQGYCALEQLCTLKQKNFHDNDDEDDGSSNADDDNLVAKLWTPYKAKSVSHPSGITPLHILCMGPSDNVGLLNQLCSLDPTAVNARDGQGNLCLISAIENNKVAFVEELLSFGVRLDMIGGQYQYKWSPIHWAAYCGTAEMFRLLSTQSIDWNQEVSSVEEEGLTLGGYNALHIAIMYNRRPATAFLLERKLIDVNARDANGNTSILLAARFCNASMILYLIDQGADISAVDTNGNNALHMAVFNKEYNDEVIPALVARGVPHGPNKSDETPEMLALYNGRSEVVAILSSSQATRKAQHVTSTDPKKKHSIRARVNRSHALSSAMERGDLDHIKAIISRAGLCSDQIHRCSDCSLFLASVYCGQSAVCKWLLKSGCDPRGQLNCGPSQGYTSIHLAAKHVEHSPDLLVLLLDTLTVEEWSTSSFSPLHVSVGRRNLKGTATLLRFLAGIDRAMAVLDDSSNLRLAEVNKRLRHSPRQLRPDLDITSTEQIHGTTTLRSSFSGTPLHLAAVLGETEHVRLLLEHGAEVDITDAFMCTPLHLAAMIGNCKTAKLLLEHGSNPNRKAKIGESTLMLAARSGSDDTFQTLVAYGADIDAQDATGQTALSYCGSLKMISHATTIGCKPVESCQSWNSFDRVFEIIDGTAAYILNSRLGDNVEPVLPDTWLVMPTVSLMMLWSCSRANLCSRSEEAMSEQAQQYLIRAALRGDVQLIRRVCSALPKSSVKPLRHALVEAASWGRLQSVKDLFRRLALYPDERTNAAILAFNAARQFQDLQAWILVDHSMEQSAIKDGNDTSIDEPIKQWSGVRQLEIPLEFRYAQVRRSLFEWAVWLHAEDKGQMIAYSRRRSKLRL